MPPPQRRETRQRTAVSAALDDVDSFVSAQELHSRLRTAGDGVGLATVYRTLQQLADDGEIEIALDAGAILIPGTDAREPIDELELEWKPATGSTLSEDAIAVRLHGWTQTLRAAVPDLAPLDISKAQRGYQLRANAAGGQA